jgi:hypothetical protein
MGGDEFVGVPSGDDGGNRGDGGHGQGGGDPDQPTGHASLRRVSAQGIRVAIVFGLSWDLTWATFRR